MKRTALVAGIVLATALLSAPTALAQGNEPSCAERQLAFTRAQVALDAALLADKAAADAKAADEALARAERALTDAREAALSGGVPNEAQTAADAARLRAELAALQDIPVAERTPAQQERIDQIEDRLPLIDAVVSAQTRLVSARVAASADADRLQDVADDTDAVALAVVREDARKAADQACGADVTTTPPTPTPPVFADVDCDEVSDAVAQDLLDRDRTDPHDLDADGDGTACEEVNGSPSGDYDQVGELPTAIDTGRA